MATKTKAKAAGDADTLFEWTKGKLAPDRALIEMLIPSNAILAEWETLQRIGCDDQLLVATIGVACKFHESKNGGGYYTGSELTVLWQSGDFDFWIVDGSEAHPFGQAPDRDPDYPSDRIAKLVRHLLSIPLLAGDSGESEPATNGKPTTKVAKRTKPKKTKQPHGTLMEVVIGSIEVLPDANPRKSFVESELEELVESIRQFGMLQPLALRKAESGNFELICGERRLRAAHKLKLKYVSAKVYDCDRATAALMRLEENEKRQDLNPLEQAGAYQTLIDEHGFTQRDLADYLKVSQGKIANAVRLLKLPEAWQQRVISREITATMGRQLATWADVPAVLDRMKDRVRHQNRGQTITADRFDAFLREGVKDASRPISGEFYSEKGWMKVRLSPKDKKREDLDVREVETYGGKQKRAFNIALWEELQKAGEERSAKAQQAKGNSPAESGSRKGAEPKLSPAEAKRKAEQKRQQHEAKLRSYYLGWLQKLILVHLDEQVGKIDPHVWLRIALYFACETSKTWQRQQELEAIIKKHGGKVTRSGPGHQGRLFEALSSIAVAEDFRLVIVDACRAWVAHPFEPHYQADLQPEVLTTLAAEFGIELQSHWACDREFLELHSKDQLQALAKEWKIKLADGKRTAMIDALDTGLRIPPPKALLKVAK